MNLPRIILLPLILFFVGCDSGNGSGAVDTNPPPATVGTWVGKTDVESLNNFINPDGTCKEVMMGDASDLGKYYLEAFKITPSGTLLELSTITANSSASGDFINKGQVYTDGKFILNPALLNQLAQQGIVFKSYDHALSANDDILIYTIKHQEVLFEGKPWIMDDSSNEFIRVTDAEFLKFIAQSKACTKNQKLMP